MIDLFNYFRRESQEVQIGATPLGGPHPIRLQSMTNTSTMDTEGCVQQVLRIVAAGGEYVRLTTQGLREAKNLRAINAALREQGCITPLIADVHFNPQVADEAALYAEKVRINPGNYVDSARTFLELEYTEEEYAAELQKIRDHFVPFLDVCKAQHTAIRIGVNHGSLSDRIMSRYGDTPEGMVESCMEFLRICVSEDFTDVVISIKASNPGVMVRTVRLLVEVMEWEAMQFPLHLGVTEAGEGEDGRIKSAVGIGALLADGLGDTIRVSLSEAPAAEIPVARILRDYIQTRAGHPFIPGRESDAFNYLNPQRRTTQAVRNIGGNQVPVVLSIRLEGDLTVQGSSLPDYIYCGNALPAARPVGMDFIVDAGAWTGEEGTWPAFSYADIMALSMCPATLKFLFLPYMALTEEVRACLKYHPEVVVVSQSNHPNRLGEHRALVHEMLCEGLMNPVVFFQHYAEEQAEDFRIKAAADMGPLLFDGFCDGILLMNQGMLPPGTEEAVAFSILQAGRQRMSKMDYISCPGCGRTLFDLEETIARVKQATSHLKSLKIAVMGCIVNGPGEMADADYGYVGAGRGKISLYKQKVCVEKNIPETEAVEKLVALIKQHGDWQER